MKARNLEVIPGVGGVAPSARPPDAQSLFGISGAGSDAFVGGGQMLCSAGPSKRKHDDALPELDEVLTDSVVTSVVGSDSGRDAVHTAIALEASAAGSGGLVYGQQVRVVDLQVRTDLNGEIGTIVDFDEAENRFHVMLRSGVNVLLKRENAVPTGPQEVMESLSVSGSCPSDSGTAVSPDLMIKVPCLRSRPKVSTPVEFDEEQNRRMAPTLQEMPLPSGRLAVPTLQEMPLPSGRLAVHVTNRLGVVPKTMSLRDFPPSEAASESRGSPSTEPCNEGSDEDNPELLRATRAMSDSTVAGARVSEDSRLQTMADTLEVQPKADPSPDEVQPKDEPSPDELQPKAEPAPDEVQPKAEPVPDEVLS